VLLVVLLLAVVVYAQVRPKPSEFFESEGFLLTKKGNVTVHGQGKWRVDQPAGMAREQFRFEIKHEGRLDYDFIQRYDLGKIYEITGNPEKCNSSMVTGKMAAVWGWVPMATYQGKVTINGRSYEEWSYTTAGVTLSLAVFPTTPNIPAVLERKTPSETTAIHFIDFQTRKPHPVWFTVPPLCKGKL